MSKFKAGDHVRIKDKEEILRAPRGAIGDAMFVFCSKHGLGFLEEMFRYCGADFVLKTQASSRHTQWRGEGRGIHDYWWDEDWLELHEDPTTVSNFNFNLEELL